MLRFLICVITAILLMAEADCSEGALIGARDGKLLAQGAQFTSIPEGLVVAEDGPVPGVQALKADGKSGVTALIKLNEPLGKAGTVSFWVRPVRHLRNGLHQEKKRYEIFEIHAVGKCYFQENEPDCLLAWDWDWSKISGASWMGTYISELPGPEWYYLTYTWDANRGFFDAYLNGTPQRVPGIKEDPWEMPGGSDVVLHPDAFQLADLRIQHSYLAPEQVVQSVPANYRGRGADLLGVLKNVKPLRLMERRGRLIYSSPMASVKNMNGWRMEGPGVIKHRDGWMEMSSALVDGEPKGHIVYWCPEDFPESFVAEWDIQVTSHYGFCIIFFAAKGENGEDVFDPGLPRRDGVFKHYTNGAITSYHISYYANAPGAPGRATTNLRKNNRFYLISTGPPGILPGDNGLHAIRLIKDGAKIQLLVDDKVIIDYLDDGKRYGPVWGSGKIGLRQMEWTTARYRNFRVWELKRAK